jgi:hypothetical protein
MGSCCYTPTKKDFLWWYWLLLVSIVGIPMLLAVLYVVWRPTADEEEKAERGVVAAWIFWLGTLLLGIGAYAVVSYSLNASFADEWGEVAWGSDGYHAWEGWGYLATRFFFATILANLVFDVRRKRRWFVRIPQILLCGFAYTVAIDPGWTRGSFAVVVAQFLVCVLPAYYWNKFKDSPDTRHAWRVLPAFLAAASAFFLLSYFGEDFARSVFNSGR